MGFFLPALFVGGLGVTQHLASRELDDIVRQAEQPVFGFWWGFSLGALTGLWIGCNFGPLLLKIKHVVSSMGGWMFLSSPPLHAGAAPDVPSASAGVAPAAGSYPFVQTSGYVPFVHSDHLTQQQHQHMRSPPHDIGHSEGRVINGENRNTGTRTGRGGGSSNGHVLPPCYSSESTHIPRQSDDLVKHAFWTQQQQHPHTAQTGRGTTSMSSLHTPATEPLHHHAEQPAKRSATGTWW